MQILLGTSFPPLHQSTGNCQRGATARFVIVSSQSLFLVTAIKTKTSSSDAFTQIHTYQMVNLKGTRLFILQKNPSICCGVSVELQLLESY